MKIAFVNQPEIIRIPPQTSILIWIHQVARGLMNRGHEVVVFGRRENNETAKEIIYEGVRYLTIGGSHNRELKIFYKLFNSKSHDLPFHSSQLFELDYVFSVGFNLKKFNPDIIHTHNYSQFAPVLNWVNPMSKLILHMHCEWLHQINRKAILRRLKYIDMVLGCSDYIINRFSERFPHFSLVRSIPNGVDVNQFFPNDDGQIVNRDMIRILFVGRVSPEKGVHVVLRAFEKAACLHPGLELEVVGKQLSCSYGFIVGMTDDDITRSLERFYPEPKTSRNALEFYGKYLKESTPNNLSDSVHFIDWVPHEELAEHYQNADIVVLPSSGMEAFGMPVVEAMAAGVPVVVASSGGMPEIIEDGKTGFVVPRENPDALADAILRLVKDKQLRISMGHAGRRRVLELYSWEKVVDQLEASYEQVCADQSRTKIQVNSVKGLSVPK